MESFPRVAMQSLAQHSDPEEPLGKLRTSHSAMSEFFALPAASHADAPPCGNGIVPSHSTRAARLVAGKGARTDPKRCDAGKDDSSQPA